MPASKLKRMAPGLTAVASGLLIFVLLVLAEPAAPLWHVAVFFTLSVMAAQRLHSLYRRLLNLAGVLPPPPLHRVVPFGMIVIRTFTESELRSKSGTELKEAAKTEFFDSGEFYPADSSWGYVDYVIPWGKSFIVNLGFDGKERSVKFTNRWGNTRHKWLPVDS